MTREDFDAFRTEAETRIRQKVTPLGLIFALWFSLALGLAILSVALCLSFIYDRPSMSGRLLVSGQLALCGLLFGWCHRAYDRNVQKYASLSLKCPSCGECLVFKHGAEAAESGLCPGCSDPLCDPTV